jgi:hypothetical protein
MKNLSKQPNITNHMGEGTGKELTRGDWRNEVSNLNK